MILSPATAFAIWSDGIHAPSIALVDFRDATVDGLPVKRPAMVNAMDAFTVGRVVITESGLPIDLRPLLDCPTVADLFASFHLDREADRGFAPLAWAASDPVGISFVLHIQFQFQFQSFVT